MHVITSSALMRITSYVMMYKMAARDGRKKGKTEIDLDAADDKDIDKICLS